MSPSSRLACLALNALAFVGFWSLVLPSAASPLPMPLPLMMADYTPSLVSANRSIAHFAPRRVGSSLRKSARATNLDSPAELQLQKYLDGMAVSSGNLSKRGSSHRPRVLNFDWPQTILPPSQPAWIRATLSFRRPSSQRSRTTKPISRAFRRLLRQFPTLIRTEDSRTTSRGMSWRLC